MAYLVTCRSSQPVQIGVYTIMPGATELIPETYASQLSADAAATAAVASYTVSPTGLGTAVGTIHQKYMFVPAAATAVDSQGMVIDFGDKGRPLALHGVAQQVAVSLGGAASLSSMSITVEWYEV